MSVVSNKYIGSFPHFSSTALQQFVDSRRRSAVVSPVRVFIAHYKAYPCIQTCTLPESHAIFHISTIMNYLKTHWNHEITDDIITRTYHRRSKEYFVNFRLSDLKNGIIIFISTIKVFSDIENPNTYSADLSDEYFLGTTKITYYYLPERQTDVDNMLKEFQQASFFIPKRLKLNLICRNQMGGLYLTSIKIRKPIITDLALHYGNKFMNIHENIIRKLNGKDGKGIVLLHGIPGSGKTHYIRYLIEEIKDKTVIYIPPDMAKDISKPTFLAFLLGHPNSVLIIEDAENIIRDRNSLTFDATQAVANLLNLSDGLLGDAMHMQIIATFNCNLGAIDKALLRQGRLIADYEFEKLSVENAKILSEKLGFGKEHISERMTLAEIYNQDNVNENDELD